MNEKDTGLLPDITVLCADEASRERAAAIGARLGLPAVLAPEDGLDPGLLHLEVSAQGVSLVRGRMEVSGDFERMIPRLKQGRLQRELLVRAARVKGVERPRAVDATAGLGEDSLLLAAAGFEVTLCEADPVIAILLEDALARASSHEVLGPIAARMRFVEGDSRETLASLAADEAALPDVVYLDPMFPGRTKSAAVKKKFQLIHGLERPCDLEAEESLLRAALAVRPRKVVVKRPIKGPCLAGVKPSHAVPGKAVRYDCIVPPR